MIPGDFKLKKPSKKQVILLIVSGIVGLFGTAAAITVGVFAFTAWWGLPLDIYGFNEGPEQPIAFPHTKHVQELGLDCTFCHRTVAKEASASIPSVEFCVTCHKIIGDNSEEIAKLRSYNSNEKPIDWKRVHRVPDHVHFVHEAHIRFFSGTKDVVSKIDIDRVSSQITLDDARKIYPNVKVGEIIDVKESQVCMTCHGDVGNMAKVKQIRPLKMSDCVNCHRDNNAPTDCITCHY